MPLRRDIDLGPMKADAFLVSALVNVRYLSGFTGSNALLVITERGATLYTDPRYTIQAQAEVSCRVKIVKGPLSEAVRKDLRRVKRLGFERARMTYALYEKLREYFKLVPAGPLIEEARTVKTPEEIELIRRSVQANSRAFDMALKRIKPSTTEADLAAEIDYAMRRNGAEKAAFETIVASGAHSALPHAQPRPVRIETGRLLLIDMGAALEGYSSDMTRTLHVGRAGTRARRLYKAVLEAQLAAIDAVRDGVTAGAVDRAARRVLTRKGMGDLFVHSTGHGLGLEIHEAPRLGKGEKTTLRAGMAVTIEPGAYIEGFGGVRIEDTVVVTENGCEVLTPTTKEFMEIG